jgi:hypothetical protein
MAGSKITRVKKERDFVQIDKFPLQDDRLSWRAKGLLAYMLSMPDDWQFYVNELHKHAKDGKDSTRSALKELESCGYLVIEKNNRGNKGKFATNNYFLHERPLSDTGSPWRVARHGQTATTNNKETNNNNTNNNKEREKKEISPQLDTNDSPKDLKEKPKKKSSAKRKKVGIPSPNYPPEYSQELITACEAYFEHRKQIGSPFSSKNAKQTKVLQTTAQVGEYGESKVIASFYEAITEGWKMNYVRKDKKTNKHGKQTSSKRGNESLSIEELFNLIDEGSSESSI